MAFVNIRRQGGAAIMTIPAEVLKALQVDVGSRLEVEVSHGKLVASPLRSGERRRYPISEILRGATPEAVQALADETGWAREGDPVGREL